MLPSCVRQLAWWLGRFVCLLPAIAITTTIKDLHDDLYIYNNFDDNTTTFMTVNVNTLSPSKTFMTAMPVGLWSCPGPRPRTPHLESRAPVGLNTWLLKYSSQRKRTIFMPIDNPYRVWHNQLLLWSPGRIGCWSHKLGSCHCSARPLPTKGCPSFLWSRWLRSSTLT